MRDCGCANEGHAVCRSLTVNVTAGVNYSSVKNELW